MDRNTTLAHDKNLRSEVLVMLKQVTNLYHIIFLFPLTRLRAFVVYPSLPLFLGPERRGQATLNACWPRRLVEQSIATSIVGPSCAMNGITLTRVIILNPENVANPHPLRVFRRATK